MRFGDDLSWHASFCMLAGRLVVYSDDGRNILEARSERRYLRGWGRGL